MSDTYLESPEKMANPLPASPLPEKDRISSPSALQHNSDMAATPSKTNKIIAAPINAIRVLAKVDDKFSDYLKMNKIGSKSKRNLTNNLISKTRQYTHQEGEGIAIMRPVPLLGKKAITLRGRGDSERDRMFKNGTQGFQNVFSKTNPPSWNKSRGTGESKARSRVNETATDDAAFDKLAATDGTAPAEIATEIEPKGPILADFEGFPLMSNEIKSPPLVSRGTTGRSAQTPGTASGGWPGTRTHSREAETAFGFALDRNVGSGTGFRSTPTPAGSRAVTTAHSTASSHSRRRHTRRSSTERASDRSLEDSTVTVQQKLTGIWSVLETSANAKIAFMRKYSTAINAADLVRAMDQWGEVAALVAMRVGLQKISIEKQQGFITGSLAYSCFKRYLTSAIPFELTCSSPELAPQNGLDNEDSRASDHTPHVVPLSVDIVRKMKKSLRKVFFKWIHHADTAGDKEEVYVEDTAIPRLLIHAVRKLDCKLLTVVRKTREVLGDFVGYGGTTIREWLMSLASALEDIHDLGPGSEKAEAAGEEADKTAVHEECAGEGDGNGSAVGAEGVVPIHHRHRALLHLTGNDVGALDSDSGED